MLALSMESSA